MLICSQCLNTTTDKVNRDAQGKVALKDPKLIGQDIMSVAIDQKVRSQLRLDHRWKNVTTYTRDKMMCCRR
jgi:hypothetical protein